MVPEPVTGAAAQMVVVDDPTLAVKATVPPGVALDPVTVAVRVTPVPMGLGLDELVVTTEVGAVDPATSWVKVAGVGAVSYTHL